jgi:hypothetical protein
MRSLTRREFVGLVGGTVSVGVAGCNFEEGEFLVTNTRVVVQRPDSIRVRVTIENETAESRKATLDVRLSYHADGDTDSAPDETWTKTDQVSVKRGSSPLLDYTFESVYREGNEIKHYTAEASLDAAGSG